MLATWVYAFRLGSDLFENVNSLFSRESPTPRTAVTSFPLFDWC